MSKNTKATTATATATATAPAKAAPAATKAAPAAAPAAPVAAWPTTAPFSTLVINVLNKAATPKAKPGTKVYRRHAQLLKMHGQTVSQYYAQCKALGIPCTANNPQNAVMQGLITLSVPK